ncbi:MAG: hypothetical protein K6C94_03010 [Candidatus Gastranaerophilales bacterium]|nr:hypothetical protein [Candidatus Gastranaerophilales bacterium]
MKNSHSRIITAALVCSLLGFADVANAVDVNNYAGLSGAITAGNPVNLTGDVTDFSAALTISKNAYNCNLTGNNHSIVTNAAVQMLTVNNGNALNMTYTTLKEKDGLANAVTLILNNGTTTAEHGAFYNAGNAALTNVGTMSLTYSTVSNNASGTVGGGINNSGKLTLTETSFTKNTATYNGGAIYNSYDAEGDPVIISGSSFGDGTEVNANSAAMGGAIYNTGKVTVRSHDEKNTNFNYNKATTSGGAVYNTSSGEVIFENNTSFVNNTAQTGGAVYNAGNVTSTRNTFDNNYASENGGAVYNIGTAAFTNGTFTKNTAATSGGAIYNKSEDKTLSLNTTTFGNGGASGSNSAENGGAVYNSSGTLSVINSTFNYNEATAGGGAIYNAAGTLQSDANTSYKLNRANNGGAIYNGENAVSATITGSTFTKNTATVGGGAVYNASVNSVMTLDGALFGDGTEANANTAARGGAVYNTGKLNSNSTTTYNYNKATTSGGAIYNAEGAQESTVSSRFAKNDAATSGGAIYNASTNNNLILSGAQFGDGTDDNANTSTNGGAVYNTGKLVVNNSTVFTNNKATTAGGAVYNAGTFTSAAESQYVLNTAVSGGAIYNAETAKESTVSGILAKNTATNGGAVYNASANYNLILSGTQFGDGTEANANTATSGGAVYNTGKLTSNNNTIYAYNKATSGGAVYNAGTLTSEEATTYTLNSAVSGGAIYNAANAKESTVNGTFTKNSATSGGAVYNASTTNNLILSGAKFGDGTNANANTATSGGAVYNAGKLNVNNNTSFNYNTATNGGAVYNDENALASTIGPATFTKNTATSGGALYNAATANALLLDDAAFGDGTEANANTAVNGGAVYNTGLLVTGDTTFNYNKAVTAEEGVDTKGGAIYNAGTLTSGAGTTYISNTAKQGGAIYNIETAAESSIVGSTFTKNSATDVGGAIVNDAANLLTIDSSTFGDGTEANANTAVYGGAIYNTGKLKTQNGTNFNYNKADVGGAIVNATAGTLTSDQTTYSKNTASTSGGAVYNLGKINSTNSTYSSNTATANYGGAIANYAKTEKVTLSGDTFENNTAIAGGAVFNMEDAQLESTNVTYSNNTAKQGGAIFNYGRKDEESGDYFYGTTTITGGNFTSNKALNGGAGGAVYNNGLLTSENVTYTSNLAVKSEDGATPGRGGAVYNDLNAQASTIKGGSFVGNQASSAGGAIFNTAENALVIDGVTFGDGTNANANMSVNGGAIYNDNKMTIKGNTDFNGNIAIENGGAIYNNYVLNITPAESETVLFRGNLSNYDAQAQTAVSNAIYNVATVTLDGAGAVTTNDSFGGTGTLAKTGTGSFNITATETNNPVVTQGVINATAGVINVDGSAGSAGAGLQGTTSVTLSDTMTSLNLKGKGAVTGKDVTVNVPVVKATSTGNVLGGVNLNVAGTEEKPVVVTVGDGENDGSLEIRSLATAEALGSANINKYTDITVATKGDLLLNPTGGDVIFEAENVNNKAVYLDSDAALTITGTNVNSAGRVKFNENKIVTADNTAKFNVTGGVTHDINTDYSDTQVVYTQSNGSVVNLNNTFFDAQEGSKVTSDAILNLNEGAVLVNDNLVIENGAIGINPNTVSEFSELKATTDNSNIKYGDNYIKLNQAHVILNNGTYISSENADPVTGKVEIGTGTNALKALTIVDTGIKENTDVNLKGGTLTLQNTADLPSTNTITIDENSVLNIANSSDVYNIKSTLVGTGTINNDNTTSNFMGNSGGFTGTYNQNGGTTRFTTGSTYFGEGVKHNITNDGSLIFEEGVKFLNETTPVVSNVVNSSLTVATAGSKSDLSTGVSKVDPNGVVSVNLTNSDLLLNKYTEVTNSTANVAIGDDGTGTLPIKNLSMGNTPYTTTTDLVTYSPTQDVTFNVYNANAAENVGTVTVGDNFTIENPNSYVTTLNMGQNTQLVLNVSDKGKLNKRELGMSVGTQQTAYAANNATITKTGNGKVYLSGDNSNFHGNIDIRNGELALNNKTSVVAGDSKYTLQNAEANGNILVNPIHNLNDNKDMAIVGINLPNTTTANVYNKTEGGTITVTGNTLVDNNSVLKMEATDAITLADTQIGSASNSSNGTIELNAPKITFNNAVNTPVLLKGQNSVMNLIGDTDIANDFTIQHATLNLNGNMNIGGNYRVGSTVNMANGIINTQNVAGNMTVTDNTQYTVDINGLTLQSDKVVVGGRIQGASGGLSLNVAGINLMFEPKEENTIYQIFEDSYARSGQENDSLSYITSLGSQVLESPVGKYVFMSAGNGRYLLSRISVQPEVQAGQIATQTGLYTNLNAYRMAFANNDTLMTLPKREREAYLNANRYVEADELTPNYSGDQTADTSNTAFDVDKQGKILYERYKYPQNTGGGWIRAYGEFEKVRFSNGPDVNNNMYGIYAGVDSKVFDHKHGFKSSYGFYAGYDGSHQTYQGTGIYQNGGTMGVTGTLYKGDFSNSTTLNIGASGSDVSSRTMGTDFWSLRGGIANKSAYNWDLADGRFIIQPHLLMSLTTVNVFPYTVGLAKADGDSIFAFQLAPGLKLAFNTANGWQPYLNCDFNWILGGASGSTVNYVRLPELSSDPWIEYGLGLQKRWGERFTGYGQAMFRSLGRSGVAFSAGMRWRVGDGQ